MQIDLFRLKMLQRGLEAEVRGMRLTRGSNCYAIIKREFGLKGSKVSVLKQYSEMLAGLSQQGTV
jgi:hypothetical protein